MSLFGLFNISRSAMFVNQAALNITNHNIANANTPGFTRREAVLETANPAAIYGGFLGSGVRISAVKRHYDTFIQSQLLGQHQNYGRSFALNQALSHIEQVFNDVKDMGLSRSLTDYFNSWQEIAAYPEGQPQRIVMLQKANALVQSARHMEMNITETLKNIEESISNIADRINVISSEIAILNENIVQIEAGQQHGKAGDLRDQRDLLLKELSEFINISYFEDKSGSLTIQAGTRNLVYGVNVNKLTIKTVEGKNDIFLGDLNITPYINKGQLGGLLDVRSNIESVALMPLRKLIASLIQETNIIHGAGFGLDASTGNSFFDPIPPGTPLQDVIKNFRIAISDPSQIAASATAAGLPGDNGNALRMARMSAENITELGSSFALFYRGIVSRVGTMSRASSDSLRFDENLLNELNNRREALSGVSLDEEAANLIRFQRSFEAGARMIKVTDELLQTILNL